MPTRKMPAAARQTPMPKPAPQPAGFIDSAPATIGSLISELRRIISELEKHTADINYAGTKEFNAHKFPSHPFDDSAYKALDDLAERMEEASNDISGAADDS